jgi:hypothetical protein
MRPECEKFVGRMRDICEGTVLTPERCDQYRAMWGLPPLGEDGPAAPLAAPWSKEKPALTSLAKRWLIAVMEWVAAGCPAREDFEVDCIYETHCKPCDRYDAQSGGCSVCGCSVNRSRFALFNKISMATQHCPMRKW